MLAANDRRAGMGLEKDRRIRYMHGLTMPNRRLPPMTVRRPRPKVMTLTEAAAERVRAIIASKGEAVAGLRIGVKNGGCAGMEYTMAWAERQEPLDEVIEDRGARILVDPKAVLFLLGTEMDYQVETLKSGFVFRNPNVTSACGCGESVSIEPRKSEELASA
jgi:iron-sulfur cluster assembly protein